MSYIRSVARWLLATMAKETCLGHVALAPLFWGMAVVVHAPHNSHQEV